MHLQSSSPIIFAHRGSSAHAPENTIAAFELAIAQQAGGIEFDVRFSADGHIIVFHDETVNRLTNGTGKVSDLTLAALKTLDVGSKYDKAFQSEKIPTLEEVFQKIGDKIFMNIELKNFSSPNDHLPDQVAEIIRAYQLEQNILISSFNPFALRRFYKSMPQVPLGLLALPGIGGIWARSFLGKWIPYQALHPERQDVNANLIQKMHRQHKQINTYTVNHPDEMKRLFGLGVDGIISDDPTLAKRVLAEFNEEQQR